MIDRWRLSSWWRPSVELAATFAAFTLVADLVTDSSRRHGHWTILIVSHALGGIVVGAAVGPITARRERRAQESMGFDRQDHLRAAAALRGREVPSDARLREMAVRLGERRLAELDRQRWLSAAFAVLLVPAVLAALLDSPWWWAAVLLLVVTLAMDWWRPRRLRRRLAALTGA